MDEWMNSPINECERVWEWRDGGMGGWGKGEAPVLP